MTDKDQRQESRRPMPLWEQPGDHSCVGANKEGGGDETTERERVATLALLREMVVQNTIKAPGPIPPQPRRGRGRN